MQILGSANEADAGHAIPMIIQCGLGCSDKAGMVGKAKVVVGAEIDDFVGLVLDLNLDHTALRRGDRSFDLHHPRFINL